MKRREFIAGTAATAALSFAGPACAQTNARSPGVKRLAIFHPSELPERMTSNGRPTFKAYFDELNRLGFMEGENLIVERYSALSQPDRFGDLAREIVASRPDVIFALHGLLIKQVMALDPGIPMVGAPYDPVTFGLSTSLARPDKNFTGVVVDAGLEIWAKRFQLLLETARKMTNVGYLDVNSLAAPVQGGATAHVLEAAWRAGIKATLVLVAGNIDRAAYERMFGAVILGGEKVDRAAYERTFDAMEKAGVDGIVASGTVELFTNRQLIVDLAARFRVAAIYPLRDFVEVGGLMAYGVDALDLMRRIANMTGQVLSGAKPIDIPFYRQTKFELALNQKAARSLGLEFPPALLTTADAVIE